MPAQPFHLRVIHFNDLHGRLADVGATEIRPVFSRIAGFIRRARAEAAARADSGVLVFAGGDELVGSPFGELAGIRPQQFECHPAYRLYSAAGVDAAVVGNHDLDWGLGMLQKAAAQDAAFSLLSANVIPASASPPGCLQSYAVFPVRGLRVGVIGLSTAHELKRLIPGEYEMRDPLAALLNLLPVLRQRSDLIVVLSHLGCSAADPIPLPGALRDVELASRLPEGAVQLIVGGHTHTILNERGLDPANLINGAAIVQAGSHAQYIGDVHIEVTPAGACVTAARLVPVDALPVDEAFDAAHVLPLARRVQALLQEPVGVSAQDPDLDPACARGAFAARESALANFVADALAARCRSAGLPVDLAMVDAPTLCDGLPQASPLTFGDLFRLSCYADSVVLIRLPVDDLQAFLDDNARRLDALDEPHEERGFVQFSRELRYRIPADAGGHAERRAIDITLNAEPLAQLLGRRREPLLIATTSFYRQFALPWELRARTRGLNILDSTSLAQLVTSLGVRDELVAFVRRAGGVTPAGGLLRDGRLRLDLNA